ncbi:unnamed protein product [Anisakis simplex]|uniref:Uncharacterized protein n=1 Tax=Anisakis simplex TaxID=6269 RepID=A0A0M3JTS8_ANISI|nr:unnamed protein product [Anisakis simplex]
MTENSCTSDTTTGSSHRGFSQKARGILLESHVVPEKKTVEKRHHNVNSISPAAPHRGFNLKAREILLDKKPPQPRPAGMVKCEQFLAQPNLLTDTMRFSVLSDELQLECKSANATPLGMIPEQCFSSC